MSELSHSFLKVNYEIRPAKQVERRIIVEALLFLSEVGFPIRDYQYTGMGAFYFVDFILFHKWLGLQKMKSVEASPSITKRVRFNAPFGRRVIQVETETRVGDAIPRLGGDARHLLWLDYDNILSDEMLEDVCLAASHLSRGSILLVTVDTEAPQEVPEPGQVVSSLASVCRRYFERTAGRYLPQLTSDDDYGYSSLPRVNIQAISGAIEEGIRGRKEAFLPLFSFIYKDGHRMLTIGGMIGTPAEKRKIKRSRLATAAYVRFSLGDEPCWIKTPLITRKERLHLDSEMPCDDDWIPEDFELAKDDIEAYREIYRFLPTYAELLL